MTRHPFLVLNTLLIAALAGILPAACAKKEAMEPKPAVEGATAIAVRTVRLAPREWIVSVPVSGTLRSLSVVEVRTEVGGRLEALHVEEGGWVRKGQLIAEIDPTNYGLALDQAKAAESVAEAGWNRAKVLFEHAVHERDRADNLLRTGGITEKDHRAAQTGVRDGEAQVKLAEAQLVQARSATAVAAKALQDCRVLSTADGQVQKKYFDRGSLLPAGASICLLIDNLQLDLECLVPSYRLAEIRAGQRIRFTTPTWGGRIFEGTVAVIHPMVEPDNRSVKVKFGISNPKGELRAGMFAKGDIEIRREAAALVISRPALVVDQQGSQEGSVYVVNDGRVHRRKVRVGDSREELLWIQEGLQAGDEVILEVGPLLKDGLPVQVLRESSSETR